MAGIGAERVNFGGIGSASVNGSASGGVAGEIGRSLREHGALRERIQRIECAMELIRRGDGREWAVSIRRDATKLLAETDAHAAREERELVPALAEEARARGGWDVDCTAWMLETNRELAAELLTGFLAGTRELPLTFDAGVWASESLALLQACSLLKEQLELEEALLFAPAMAAETMSVSAT